MKYGATLTLLGIVLIGLGVRSGIAGWILVWLGVDFLLLGIAHLRQKHGIFGKRSDGTLPLWSWFVYGPLLLLSLAVWHAVRLTSSEPAFNRVSDQIVVGRRLLPGEGPGEFANIVDLTAEFAEPSVFRRTDGYLAFPVLDASAPSPERLHAVVSNLRPGSVFIHCAQGHGRTGLFALAVLLDRAVVQNVDEGLAMLTKVRPGIRLNRQQRQCAEAYAKLLAASQPQT